MLEKKTLPTLMAAVLLLAGAAGLAACGDDKGDGTDADFDTAADVPADMLVDGILDVPQDDAEDPADGDPGDGPCPEERLCGALCCAGGEICDLGRCRPDCGDRPVCGDPAICCEAGQTCLSDGCVDLGDTCDRCMGCGPGEFCDPALGRCVPAGAVDEACVFVPPPGAFDPVLLWSWAGEGSAAGDTRHVIMMPVVAHLDDDDGDGAVTDCDVPEVAVIAYNPATTNDGWLRVLDGATGTLDAEANLADDRLANQTQIAAGDIDGDGVAEIVAGLAGTSSFCGRWGWHADVTPAAFRIEDGALIQVWQATGQTATAGGGPAIADLDGDGEPEVLIGDLVLNGGDGSTKWRASGGPGISTECASSNVASLPIAVDLDSGTEGLEVLIGRTAYWAGGGRYWTRDDLPEGVAAVANLDGDDEPEIAYVAAGALSVLNHDGSTVCGPVSPEEASIGVGGAPTIADFDGDPDGMPEIGVAGRSRYAIFKADCSLLAASTTNDNSAVTSSTVFDLEGDGVAEVVYADEDLMYVYRYDGTATLEVVLSIANSSATGLEGPVVADIDGDGRAEFVVVGNGATGGVRAFHDSLDRWAGSRPVWNQHTYHVTNIGPHGEVPEGEIPHFDASVGPNSFRQNQLLGNEQWVPDLVPDGIDANGSGCPESVEIFGRVRNAGALTAAAGIPVTFYLGEPEEGAREAVGTVRTTTPIMPGGSEAVSIVFDIPPEEAGGTFIFHYVVDDDGTGAGERTECHEDNNTSPTLSVTCWFG
ncbi:MAG: FG-GAP-like repeat-containing protein [Pseudomonadota bacterium]